MSKVKCTLVAYQQKNNLQRNTVYTHVKAIWRCFASHFLREGHNLVDMLFNKFKKYSSRRMLVCAPSKLRSLIVPEKATKKSCLIQIDATSLCLKFKCCCLSWIWNCSIVEHYRLGVCNKSSGEPTTHHVSVFRVFFIYHTKLCPHSLGLTWKAEW